MKQRILVVDDEANMRHMLTELLANSGFEVDSAENGLEALKMLELREYSFVFCDIRMPKLDGIGFLEAASDKIGTINVIMMSAYGTLETAVTAMKKGAYDYISKPFKPDEVLLTIKKAQERERLQSENVALKRRLAEMEHNFSFGRMVAESSVMKAVFELAAKVAMVDTTVLITGASGTGKELVAKGIHECGTRASYPLIPVNCGGIPETLLESELFGHKKGSFTGAEKDHKGLFSAAEKGTILFDEVGDLPPTLQVKLLRVLQEDEIRPVGDTQTRKVDVRILAATSKNLKEEVQKGNFREDLFYRLNVIQIRIPPLIERSEDIPILCLHFIDRYNRKLHKSITGVSPAAMALLIKHDWPGNVRELENVIERAVVLAESDVIDPENLPSIFHNDVRPSNIEDIFQCYSLKTGKQVLEKNLIQRALEATGGNRTRAAKLLEISHPSLLSKMKLYDIE